MNPCFNVKLNHSDIGELTINQILLEKKTCIRPIVLSSDKLTNSKERLIIVYKSD